jgi:hypothetical protein
MAGSGRGGSHGNPFRGADPSPCEEGPRGTREKSVIVEVELRKGIQIK